jgi:hypothetical protein
VDRPAGEGRVDPTALLKVARWRASENELFSGLLHDPGRYERCLSLMAALSGDLQRRCPTKELTLALDPGLAAAEAAVEHDVDVAGLDLDLVGAAALANHWWRLELADSSEPGGHPTNTSQNGQR